MLPEHLGPQHKFSVENQQNWTRHELKIFFKSVSLLIPLQNTHKYIKHFL